MKNSNRIPVTILSGFLGAGKTTLLQRILTEKHGIKIAVIENEFANVDIDSSLVKNKSDILVELFNGCVCCSIQKDLMNSLMGIALREDPIDRVVIETTGVANPSNLVQAFLSDHLLRSLFQLDAVVTVLDAKNCLRHINETQDFRDQISFADLVVINKTDLVSADELDQAEEAARRLNRSAEFLRTSHCAVALEKIFGWEAYENESIRPESISRGKLTELPKLVASLSLDISGELREDKFMEWFQPFIAANHERLFRTKGILSFAGHSRQVVIQGVHEIFSATHAENGLISAGKSKMVFIGRDLPKDEIVGGIKSALAEAKPEFGSFQFFTAGENSGPSPIAPLRPADLQVRIV